jgi:hypothetical protein
MASWRLNSAKEERDLKSIEIGRRVTGKSGRLGVDEGNEDRE